MAALVDHSKAKPHSASGWVRVSHENSNLFAYIDRREIRAVGLASQHDDVFELLAAAGFRVGASLKQRGFARNILELKVGEIVVRAICHGDME